jgi:hypothetical protein
VEEMGEKPFKVTSPNFFFGVSIFMKTEYQIKLSSSVPPLLITNTRTEHPENGSPRERRYTHREERERER